MTIDLISIVLAVAGGLATLWLKRRNGSAQPAPVPPPQPTPLPADPSTPQPNSGTPVLDAILAILKQLSAQKPVAGVEAKLTHADDSNVTIHISRENKHEPA